MHCPFEFNSNSATTPSETQIFSHVVIKSGFFNRRSDGLILQRYWCKDCRKRFSSQTQSPLRYQKKRELNSIIFSLFASGISQRRLGRVLKINRKTVVRKFIHLGQICLLDMNDNKHLPERKIAEFIFDEMESFEHTKLKPISIALAVEKNTRLILDFRISPMKAKGHLAVRAYKKYGYRKDERRKNLYELLHALKPRATDKALINSDMNPHYNNPVRDVFPNSLHLTFKGKRGCVVGQGELKATSFDPIFSFNHTAAMLRANINRLFRRTWNTTKKIERLNYHIAIYIFYHNLRLLNELPLNDI
jgi:hypothetical protein